MVFALDRIYLATCTNLYVNAEYVFKFLNSHDLELTLDHTDEIQKQSALQEAEEPELSLNNTIITVSKLSEDFDPMKLGSRYLRSLVQMSSQQQLDT